MLRLPVVDGDLDQIYLAYLPGKGDLDSVDFLKWKIQVSRVPAGTSPSGIPLWARPSAT